MARALGDEPAALAVALVESLKRDPDLREELDDVTSRLATLMEEAFDQRLRQYVVDTDNEGSITLIHVDPASWDAGAWDLDALSDVLSAQAGAHEAFVSFSLAATLAMAMSHRARHLHETGDLPEVLGAISGWALVPEFDPELLELPAGDDERAEDPTLAERFGPAPSAQDLQRAHRQEHAAFDRDMRIAMAGALTRKEAAERLGITPQAVSERKSAGALVAVRRGREVFFPAWQFAGDGTVPGLPEVVDAWPDNPLSLSVWAVTPSTDLGGQAPAQALAKRRVAAVLDLIEAIKVAGW